MAALYDWLWRCHLRPRPIALHLFLVKKRRNGKQVHMPAVTIDVSDKQRVFSAAWVDVNENQVSAPGYGFANWAGSDNGAIVSLAQIGTGVAGQCTVTMTGAVGTFTLTARSSKSGSPDLVGTIDVTVVGPVADHLAITLDALPLAA
jgi:hypothetical protein